LQEAYQIRRGEECLKKCLAEKKTLTYNNNMPQNRCCKQLLQWDWQPLFVKWT
jgi:hypothetical protein